MDFNTGAGGTGSSGGSSAGPGGSPRQRQTVSAAEFRYTDPVSTFISTVRSVVTAPVDFFRGILRQGDLVNPLIFGLICYEIYTILGGLLRLAGIGTDLGFG